MVTEHSASGITFGLQVREARRHAALSQEALALRAGINKETVMRIEQGFDTHVTTIGKLRRALPAIPRATENESKMSNELSDMAARIGHLIQGLHTWERLHNVRAFVLQQLHEEHDSTRSPASQLALDAIQERSERRLVSRSAAAARGTKRPIKGKRNGKADQH